MTKRKEKRSSTRYVGYHKTDEIECQIRYKYEGDKRSQIDTVFGRAVDPLSKSPIGNGSYHQRKVSNGDVDSAEAYVLNAVLKEWIKKNKPKRPVNSTPASEEKYTERLNKITINDAINLIQKQRHWATLTVRQALTYLRGRVAKLLNIYAENPLEVDWGAIEKGLKSKANGSTHVKKSLDHSIGNQFHYAAECYEILRQNCPELNLPYLDFPDLRTTKAASPEKRKWLPMKVRIMFVRALWELANNQVPLAFAAALMYYCGLRPAEAMAPCMGDFHISADGSFGTYRVSSQIQEKKQIYSLKTPNSYRTVILPKEAVHFIKLRLEQIRAAGISEKKIAAIPLTSNADAIYDFINPDNLSDFCGGFLNQCFKECQERQIKDSSKSSECTAYTLRRDFCGRAIDGCGLDPAVVDCLVGHKQVEKNSPLATIQQGNADDQAVIAQKLGRVATLLEFSSSQAVKTLRFSPPVQIRTLGNGRVKLEADHDCILHFTVATTEPCDPLTIITNGKLRSGHNTVTTEAEDSRSSRRAAPVIYTQAFYDKYSDIGCALAHDYISKIKGGTAV